MSEGHFYDEVRIFVQGGTGGRGIISFRRERGVPRGGPNGGNGGNGGSVIIKASSDVSTLVYFHFKNHFVAPNGRLGGGGERTGGSGADILLAVPVGTVVKDDNGITIADLSSDGQSTVIARGGSGGKGNAHYKSATLQAPRIAENGQVGQKRNVLLELKLLADIGLVGLPNAGKSTLLASISKARPKIAPYPFTTLKPHLGIVTIDERRSLVVADLPGLIEEASKGKGLGDRFLRHVERSKALLHLIDMGQEFDRSPRERYTCINDELRDYDQLLMNKKQLVVGTKLDITGARERLAEFERELNGSMPVIGISCWTGEGLSELSGRMFELIGEVDDVSR